MDNKTKATLIVAGTILVYTGIVAVNHHLTNKLRAKTLIELEKIELQKKKIQAQTPKE